VSGTSLVELRVLDGPNLYFPRPAIKLTLDVAGLLGLPEEQAAAAAAPRAGPPGGAGGVRGVRVGSLRGDRHRGVAGLLLLRNFVHPHAKGRPPALALRLLVPPEGFVGGEPLGGLVGIVRSHFSNSYPQNGDQTGSGQLHSSNGQCPERTLPG